MGTPTEAYGYNTDLMLDVMKMIRYDAVTLGEADLRRGLATLKAAATRGGFDIVSANLYRTGEKRVRPFPAYVIRKAGKTRVGVIGVIGKEERSQNLIQFVWVDQQTLEKEGLVVTDPLVALKEVLPEVRRRSDVVVVLAHTGLDRAKEIATLVPGVDVVLAGHGAPELAEPERPGAVVAKCGQRSDKLGAVRIVVERGEITSYSGATVALQQDKTPFDPKIRKIVWDALELDEHGNRKSQAVKKVVVDTTAASVAPKDTTSAPAEDTASRVNLKGDHFLGVSSCKDCHLSEWARWSDTPHAITYQRLAVGDDWNNHACLPCHVTGYGAPGGHSTSSLSPDLWNVQCEECHGMGTQHSVASVEVSEASCLKCHTKDQDPDFDFARDVVKVIH